MSSGPRPAPQLDVVFGRRPVMELLRAGRSAQKVLISQRARPAPVLDDIKETAQAQGVVIQTASPDEIDRLTEGANHQGVVALVARYRYSPLPDLLAAEAPALLFLDGVMDPHNLGSLLRSADGAGFDGVVIPAHRAAAVTQTVRRVSAGAAEVVRVARVGNLGAALEEARKANLWIVGLDADGHHDVWSSELMEPPVGLVLGAEDRGLSRVVRSRCDALCRIPSGGRLGSLNVAVAGALAMFEVARRRHGSATL